MGHFTLGMARLVGDSGQVIAVDLQVEMLERVGKRARQAGLESRIRLQRCQPDRIGITEPADFALAFWMVHEVPNTRSFLQEVRGLLKPTAHFLLVEPKLHVSAEAFLKTVEIARSVGLQPVSEPKIAISRAQLFAPVQPAG
jgi:ubiquinone/menaquinone biosynthesis C-methylase UbiE